MYKRLTIFSMIIFGALCAMTVLGYVAVGKWAEGLAGKRLGEFAEAAEQIRGDVKRKLDEFMQAELNRPYTDYQFYYVPDIRQNRQQQQSALVRSPLAGVMENSFAYGYFQIGPDGKITTPNDEIAQDKQSNTFASQNFYNIKNVEENVLPVLKREKLLNGKATAQPDTSGVTTAKDESKEKNLYEYQTKSDGSAEQQVQQKTSYQAGKSAISTAGKALQIESLQKQPSKTQVVSQRRDVTSENIMLNTTTTQQQQTEQRTEEERQKAEEKEVTVQEAIQADKQTIEKQNQQGQKQGEDSDMVQIRIEPFVPVVVGGGDGEKSIFGGQVFYLRHIQIEDRHFLQGFKFNESRLLEEIEKSANQIIGSGMGFKIFRRVEAGATISPILDFGFGEVVLNLRELNPGWINRNIQRLQWWYFGIVAIVFLAVTGGLASLWLNARAQLKLAEKKDDFISAVSHELRTPLTSIRMYSEMLDKGWVKNDVKRAEYYKGMQQETERLSRLVENVLDFSRIQKKRKKYSFKLGDINECIRAVAEMMKPFAEQNGFSIVTGLGELGEVKFDRDAVTQIVVNLIDNAVKYSKAAEDKTILVSTYGRDGFIIIEVEDHGPGVPHRQRKKIFEEFYRIGSEATRETKGTGLGLALVKKFAEAHNGFVEILNARPKGSIFRVALSTTT